MFINGQRTCRVRITAIREYRSPESMLETEGFEEILKSFGSEEKMTNELRDMFHVKSLGIIVLEFERT
ncbi:MAG: hypothetical protein WCX74_01970 [Candidatus Paceibacterota bacterium]